MHTRVLDVGVFDGGSERQWWTDECVSGVGRIAAARRRSGKNYVRDEENV